MDKTISKKSLICILIFSLVALILALCTPFCLSSQDASGNYVLFGSFTLAVQQFPMPNVNYMTVTTITTDMFSNLQTAATPYWGGWYFLFTYMGAPSIVEGMATTANFVAYFAVYSFIAVIALDILLALLLLLFKGNEKFRKVCKVLSMIAGIVMAVDFTYFLMYSIGIFLTPAYYGNAWLWNINNVLNNILYRGFIWSVVCTILAGLLISKQFKWFSKPY